MNRGYRLVPGEQAGLHIYSEDSMIDDPKGDPIARLYEQMLNERVSGDDPGHRPDYTARPSNIMLAVTALLAEVALRYESLDRRLQLVEARLAEQD